MWYIDKVLYGNIFHIFFSYYGQHSETASHCLHNIAMIALLHPALADLCIEKLLSFLQSRDDSIVSHALAALRGECR
jgi:hypothetical protein